ncbi:ATP-binding protein [Nostoc sp.]|uniref:ATP-binding protein n=1 Tax=Nostoc sp. TaxID=1180 RepID=UPI002FFA24A8
MIILPLPFMDVMIIEGYRKNPDAAHKTINYLITSTNQQKVAAEAISSIAVDILNRCQRLSDIVEIANQLVWIPSPPPKELGVVLPEFLEISQDVRASEEATSLYRQYELLNIPITVLCQLRQSLVLTKNARVAVSFGNTAQNWLTILETAQRTLEEQAQQSKEIRQVYIAGNSLDPETAKNHFKGRIDIFREIETFALSEQPPVLLLYGGRRTGKTSALKYLPYRIGSDIVPLLVDLQGAASATTLKGLAENLAQQIIEAARRLPRTVNLPYPDAKKLAEDPFPALQTWLTEIERSNRSKRFLLCLDEYERLDEVVKATSSRAPLNFIRNLLQHHQNWILLFSGSHELSELDDYWSDYLINTRALRMTYLQESEARDLILHPVENFTNIYEPTAVDAIIQLTRCQPFLIQLVCYELVESLNGDVRKNQGNADTVKATAQNVEEIIPQVLARGVQYFRELWTRV